jgi:hypothetical protein
MTKTCPDCGLSLQGRDNEYETCSDCLLEESLSNSVSKDDMSVSDKGLTDEQYKEKPMNNKEILLDPIEMTEELMFHIFNSEFGGELDSSHRFFELYLQLQLYKEKMLKDEEDAVVAIYNDEVGA